MWANAEADLGQSLKGGGKRPKSNKSGQIDSFHTSYHSDNRERPKV